MSYTTHSGGNGVYSYQDEGNIYHCVDCDLLFTMTVDYINHLKWHKQNGCYLPTSIFNRISLDAEQRYCNALHNVGGYVKTINRFK